MIDIDQLARNFAFGAVHRPAQVLRWMGGLFQNEAAPVGAAMIEAANALDYEAYEQLQPYVEPLPTVTFAPPPPPVTVTGPKKLHELPKWVYTPAPSLTWAQQTTGYYYAWIWAPGTHPQELQPDPGGVGT